MPQRPESPGESQEAQNTSRWSHAVSNKSGALNCVQQCHGHVLGIHKSLAPTCRSEEAVPSAIRRRAANEGLRCGGTAAEVPGLIGGKGLSANETLAT